MRLSKAGDVVAGVGGVDGERRSVGARLQVAAGAEGLVAGAGQHDRADRAIGLCLVEAGRDAERDRFVQRIAARLAVDDDRLDGATSLDAYRICHDFRPWLSFAVPSLASTFVYK